MRALRWHAAKDIRLDEVPEPREAPHEHAPRTAADSDVAGPEHFKRDACRVHQIPDLMSEKSESRVLASGFSIERRLIASSAVLRDGARNGIVKASVQRAKIIDADRCALFHGQVCDRLAHVAIVMDDL